MGAVTKIFRGKPKPAKAAMIDTAITSGAYKKVEETPETTTPRGESESYAANMGRSQARRRRRGRGTVLASAMGTQDTLG